MLSLFSFGIASLPIIKGCFFDSHRGTEAIFGSNLFILYDLSAGANGHTELIFSHIGERFGITGALSCIILILFVIAQLVVLSLTTKNRGARFALTGLAAFLTTQTLFDLLVAMHLIVNPASGVSLPFVSYGGSQLVMEVAIMGGIIGLLFDRRHEVIKAL